jgi:hypothetical protein
MFFLRNRVEANLEILIDFFWGVGMLYEGIDERPVLLFECDNVSKQGGYDEKRDSSTIVL